MPSAPPYLAKVAQSTLKRRISTRSASFALPSTKEEAAHVDGGAAGRFLVIRHDAGEYHDMVQENDPS